MHELNNNVGMKKLAYVLLAHERVALVASHVHMLLDADPTGQVVVHYDGSAPRTEFEALRSALADFPRAWLVPDPVKCEWGNFTLVEAVVHALRLIRDRNLECDYVCLLSCSCLPIKPIAKLKRFLSINDGMEFIEASPPSWINDGLREERYSLYHWFSWRTQRMLFDICVVAQRKLRVKRRIPKGLTMRFGSQWWCLTRKTCDGILGFIDERPRDYEFFRRTWIPDEMFFQTVATLLAGEARIAGKNLTFFMFGAKGRPVSFYDDHCGAMDEVPFFFARKISPSAKRLRESLGKVATGCDDGGAMPSLDRAPVIAKYRNAVGRSVHFARPGQSFYAWQIFSGWPSSLAAYPGVFCILYGPAELTRLVRERLNHADDVTALGRIFHPDKVDLGPLGADFAGFSPDDGKIRDFDRALYLSRLLQRCKGLPVIEMTPGDGEYAERYFHQSNKVLFISCVPANIQDADMRRLYWLLVAGSRRELTALKPILTGLDEDIATVRSTIDAYLEKNLTLNHRKWVDEVITGQKASDHFLSVYWDSCRGLQVTPPKGVSEKFAREFGPGILPIIEFLSDIASDGRGEAVPTLAASPPSALLQAFARAILQPDPRAKPDVAGLARAASAAISVTHGN